MTDQRDSTRTTFRTSLVLVLLVSVAAVAIAVASIAADAGRASAPGPSDDAATTAPPTTAARQASTSTSTTPPLRPIDRPGHAHWIVNKDRPLPAGYEPPNLVVPNVELRLERSKERMHLRKSAARALERMFADAAAGGYRLRLVSGFRSLESQAELYESYREQDGTAANQYSARPGTSEHQTGLAADVGRFDGLFDTDVEFAATPEGKWVAANAHRFGFIIRYPRGKQKVTGYTYEPWHLRYVGKGLAATLHRSGDTMEEHYGIARPGTSTTAR